MFLVVCHFLKKQAPYIKKTQDQSTKVPNDNIDPNDLLLDTQISPEEEAAYNDALNNPNNPQTLFNQKCEQENQQKAQSQSLNPQEK